jgi:hypothetical protein
MRLVTLPAASVRGCLDREDLPWLQFMCFPHVEDELNALVAEKPDTFDPCPEIAVDEHVAMPRHRATDETAHNRRPRAVVDSDRIGHLKARCHRRAILMSAIEWASVRARKLSAIIIGRQSR